jgi:TPR repeat protein
MAAALKRVLAFLFAAALIGCKGSHVENDFYAGIQGQGIDTSYSRHDTSEDLSPRVDLARGINNSEFYKTTAKYQFLDAFVQGLASAGAPKTAEAQRMLKERYGRAMLGDAIEIAFFDHMFAETVEQHYPKDDPRAQFNLGLVYSDLHEYAQARVWLQKASGAGMPEATALLLRIKNL